MSHYVLLMTLTPEGRERALQDVDYLLRVEKEVSCPGVETLGLYAVLGPYDFVTIVQAPGNEAIARFSIALGVKAGVHITTLPVIPAASLDEAGAEATAAAQAEIPSAVSQGFGSSTPLAL